MTRLLDRRLRRAAAAAVAALAAVATAAPAVAADLDAALGLMPADTAVVFGANIDRFRKSPLFTDLTNMLGSRPDAKEALEKLRSAGLDPRTNLDTILVALTGDPETAEGPLVLLPGHADLTKIAALAKAEGEKVETAKYKGVETMKAGDDASLAVVDKHLVLGPPALVKQSVDASKGGKGARGGRLAKLVAAADTKKDFWLVLDAGGAVKKALGEPGAPPELKDLKSAHAALDFAQGMGLRVTVDLGNAAAAKKLSDQLKEGLAQAGADPGLAMMGLGPAVQKMKVEAQGNEMRIALDLTQDEVNRIKTMMVGMMGMMMQGAKKEPLPPGGKAAPALPPPVPAVPAVPDGTKKQ